MKRFVVIVIALLSASTLALAAPTLDFTGLSSLSAFNAALGVVLFAAIVSFVGLYFVRSGRSLNGRFGYDVATDTATPARSGGRSTQQLLKRYLDLLLAVVLLVALSPLLVVVALLILVLEGRPVFYVSRRHISASGSVPIFKFRTMVRDAVNPKHRLAERFTRDGYLDIPLACEVYTPIGRFLERTQLVEAPQLLNIILHGLSFVGNRPLPAKNVADLATCFPNWAQRFESPAGMTGIAQIVGRLNLTATERMELESLYSSVYRHGNILVCDVKIIFVTVLVVVFAKGIALSQARTMLRGCFPKGQEEDMDQVGRSREMLVE